MEQWVDIRQRVLREGVSKRQILCLLPLPLAPFDACRIQSGQVNSELLVRFDDNDYSVPMEYA